MNNLQVAAALKKHEDRIEALESQGPSDVTALQAKVVALEAQVKVLTALLSPTCYRCGSPANHKERILHGGKYSDMWACGCGGHSA